MNDEDRESRATTIREDVGLPDWKKAWAGGAQYITKTAKDYPQITQITQISALTGRTMEEIAEARDRTWQSHRAG